MANINTCNTNLISLQLRQHCSLCNFMSNVLLQSSSWSLPLLFQILLREGRKAPEQTHALLLAFHGLRDIDWTRLQLIDVMNLYRVFAVMRESDLRASYWRVRFTEKNLSADWHRTCFEGPLSLNRTAELFLSYTSVWRQGGFVLCIVQSLFSMLFWPIAVSRWIL